MDKQLNNILDLATNLVITGKADVDKAVQMAIEIDNKKCLEVYDKIEARRNGINFYENPIVELYEMTKNSVYESLSNL